MNPLSGGCPPPPKKIPPAFQSSCWKVCLGRTGVLFMDFISYVPQVWALIMSFPEYSAKMVFFWVPFLWRRGGKGGGGGSVTYQLQEHHLVAMCGGWFLCCRYISLYWGTDRSHTGVLTVTGLKTKRKKSYWWVPDQFLWTLTVFCSVLLGSWLVQIG